jgi:hypothetical protein
MLGTIYMRDRNGFPIRGDTVTWRGFVQTEGACAPTASRHWANYPEIFSVPVCMAGLLPAWPRPLYVSSTNGGVASALKTDPRTAGAQEQKQKRIREGEALRPRLCIGPECKTWQPQQQQHLVLLSHLRLATPETAPLQGMWWLSIAISFARGLAVPMRGSG